MRGWGRRGDFLRMDGHVDGHVDENEHKNENENDGSLRVVTVPFRTQPEFLYFFL